MHPELAMTKGDLAKPVKGERYDCICASSRSEGASPTFLEQGPGRGIVAVHVREGISVRGHVAR